MKTFLKIDYYIQLICLAIILPLAIYSFFFNNDSSFKVMPVVFYFGVGGIQLISFLVRLFLKYKKSLIYKIYGFLIVPIWIEFFFCVMGLNIVKYLAFILLPSFFYAPIMAILYIYDCYTTTKYALL